jgi:argininosuccinate lyase
VSFRDAHEITGALVAFCESNDLSFDDVSDGDLASVSALLTPEVRDVLTVEGSIGSRNGVGGTAPERVAEQLALLTARVTVLAATLRAT